MPEKIVNVREFSDWLKIQPKEISVAIAARSALRMVPHVYFAFGKTLHERPPILAMAIFRANILSWVYARFPEKAANFAREKGPSSRLAVANAAEYVGITYGNREKARDALYTAADAVYAAYSNADGARAGASSAIARSSYFKNFDPYAEEFSERPEQLLDVDLIDSGVSSTDLAEASLWADGKIPNWAEEAWQKMKSALNSISQDWDVWTDWYEDRLHGRPANEEIELARLDLIEKLWNENTSRVNKEYRRVKEDYSKIDTKKEKIPEQKNTGDDVTSSIQSEGGDFIESEAIDIPPQKPATLEPTWIAGKLTLVNDAAEADSSAIDSALAALRGDFQEFVEDLSRDNFNIDERLLNFLRKISKKIPDAAPPNHILFSVAHNEFLLREYSATVAEEWPDFLAARYQALTLHFSRVMRKFPEWRAFLAESEIVELNEQQIEAAKNITKEISEKLGDSEKFNPVDPVIPEQMSEMNKELEKVIGADQQNTPLSVHSHVIDLLESINNTLKRLFEAAVATGAFFYQEAKADGKKILVGARKQYDKELEKIGEDGIKWIKRYLAAGGTATLGGSVGVWHHLATQFPQFFSWVEPFLKLFPWL